MIEKENIKNSVNDKENEELIDILMATYNSNIHFLKIQIDSILNQSYKNIKLIISDDASNNKEVKETLKQYEEKDSRVKVYFQEKNLGYLKNFEFLLSKSTAEYIAFSDHDDIWYKNKIQRSIEILKEKKVDLVYCDAKQIDENGQVFSQSYLKNKNMPKINGKNNILTFSRHIAIGCSQLFTKKIKEQMLPFEKEVMAHDWISVYLASKQNGVECIEEPLFGYRLHNSNEFGGRSLKQNLSNWKTENGISYKSYKKYRNERVVKTAYLNGSLMCEKYRKKLNLEKSELEEDVINYYNKLLKTKIINFQFNKYKKYLSFNEMGKRRMKEELIFHFPLISYFIYIIK